MSYKFRKSFFFNLCTFYSVCKIYILVVFIGFNLELILSLTRFYILLLKKINIGNKKGCIRGENPILMPSYLTHKHWHEEQTYRQKYRHILTNFWLSGVKDNSLSFLWIRFIYNWQTRHFLNYTFFVIHKEILKLYLYSQYTHYDKGPSLLSCRSTRVIYLTHANLYVELHTEKQSVPFLKSLIRLNSGGLEP